MSVHDHHIDDLRDSGIKVRYHKEDVDVNEGFDKIGKSGEDHVYFTDTSEQGRSSKHSSGTKHSDSGEDQMHFKFKSHKIDVNDAAASGKKLKMSHVQQRVKAAGVHPDHHAQVSKHIYNHMAEAIERKADSKLIMVTDPVTGKTILRKAPRKEIEIGKGKMESVQVDEISDKMKVNYINKANKQITDKEKAGKGQDTMKRRMGVRMAKSKLGEAEYSNKEVRMGKGVAFDKRYKGGNMTGAYKTINKIKKGLGDHPKVRDALRRANEEFNKGE